MDKINYYLYGVCCGRFVKCRSHEFNAQDAKTGKPFTRRLYTITIAVPRYGSDKDTFIELVCYDSSTFELASKLKPGSIVTVNFDFRNRRVDLPNNKYLLCNSYVLNSLVGQPE